MEEITVPLDVVPLDTVALVKTSAEEAAKGFERRLRKIDRDLLGVPSNYQLEQVGGDLRQRLEALLPPGLGAGSRTLFLPTTDGGCVYLTNGWRGTDISSRPQLVGRECEVDVVLAIRSEALDPLGPLGYAGSWPATRFVYHTKGAFEPSRMVMAQLEDSGRSWVFEQSGEPMAFEDVSAYTARRKRDRLPQSAVVRYLAALGMRPWDASYYDLSRPAWLLRDLNPALATEGVSARAYEEWIRKTEGRRNQAFHASHRVPRLVRSP